VKENGCIFFIGLSSLCAAIFLGGCSRMLLLDPKGPIGLSERFVTIAAIGLVLIVFIPVVAMVLLFPWKYRASNTLWIMANWNYCMR
jgi:cytochrome o ubiquinol oxidase subunit II